MATFARYLTQKLTSTANSEVTAAEVLTALQRMDAGERDNFLALVTAGNAHAVGTALLSALREMRNAGVQAQVTALLADPSLTVQELLVLLGEDLT